MTIVNRLIRASHARWQRIALIAAINTGIALAMWADANDTRPFWHPLVSAQSFGFCIAWAFNLLRPWKSDKPLRMTGLAVLLGVMGGLTLVIVLKQYSPTFIASNLRLFFWTALSAAVIGFIVSAFFLMNFRDAQSRIELERLEAERERFARLATDAKLEALQAQVQPHFLFNTLGTVQALIGIDPAAAAKLLEHLSDYLRSSLIEVKARTVTLGPECQRVRAYLEIMQIRLGSRLKFSVTCPEALESVDFPPHLLTGLAENAIKHGIEVAGAGRIDIDAELLADQVRVRVSNKLERPLPPTEVATRPSHGLGHQNIKATLAALYGDAATFYFANEDNGACAVITLPAGK